MSATYVTRFLGEPEGGAFSIVVQRELSDGAIARTYDCPICFYWLLAHPMSGYYFGEDA